MKITVGFFSIALYTALVGAGGYLIGQGRIKADLSKPGTLAVTWDAGDGKTKTEILDAVEVEAAAQDHPEGATKAAQMIREYKAKARQVQQLQGELAEVVEAIKSEPEAAESES